MMALKNANPLVLWAAREVLRRPGRHLLLAASLASLTFLVATALLFSRGLERTWSRLLDQAPDLIVRRIDAGGWAPIPVKEALAAVATVPGALAPQPRLWGIVPGPDGPLTVTASAATIADSRLSDRRPPLDGQAIVGAGVAASIADRRLVLDGRLELTMIDRFSPDTGLATHDIVWIAPADARRLLGIPAGHASDVAIHLFHRQEEEAIRADLAAAFPWPVHITGRSTTQWRHQIQAARMGGLAIIACVPALLAMVLIVTTTATGGGGRQFQWGLLKSMGWTTANIVHLQVLQSVIVGLPAVTVGLASAYAVVFYPPSAAVAAAWVTGGLRLPLLALDHSGAALTMAEIAAVVAIPYLAAAYLATIQAVARDPLYLLQENSWR